VIIGSGNVATVLGKRIRLAGHQLLQVFSHDKEHASRLAGELECGYTDDWKEIDGQADLYLVALSDSALAGDFTKKMPSLKDRLVAHTAGSVSRDVLRGITNRPGVLYPLQSLRKEIDAYPEIPLLVDAQTPEDIALLTGFAKTISGQVQTADDEMRRKLHLGAVLVNNFSNHLFRMAEDYCRREKVDFRLLLPVIKETAKRLTDFSPGEVQTGPAVRKDQATIEKHLSMLSNYVSTKELYELFTKQIQDLSVVKTVVKP
jgi:predicted short-subunit dehydrogenase-like oxidoreductase (DUF2520 family)